MKKKGGEELPESGRVSSSAPFSTERSKCHLRNSTGWKRGAARVSGCKNKSLRLRASLSGDEWEHLEIGEVRSTRPGVEESSKYEVRVRKRGGEREGGVIIFLEKERGEGGPATVILTKT